jgi:hypothetical protein
VTAQTATLIAAGVAASASLVSLIVNLVAVRGAEARAAHRKALEPHLGELGQGVHSVIAVAVLLHKRARQGQAAGAWLENGEQASQVLKRKRTELKYPLLGVDEALRTLSRIPTWSATYRGHASGDRLLSEARSLAAIVDRVVAKSYAKGRPPTALERWRLSRRVERVRAAWGERFSETNALEIGSRPAETDQSQGGQVTGAQPQDL